MPAFASIASDIQLLIAKKIDYLDLKEFELSSKYGKSIVCAAKTCDTIEVRLVAQKGDLIICVDRPDRRKCTKWSTVGDISNLPRFRVTTFIVTNEFPLSTFSHFTENARFAKSRVFLDWKLAPPDRDIFVKIKKALCITKFSSELPPDSRVLKSVRNSCIKSVDIPIGNDDKALLHIKSKNIKLCDNSVSPRIATVGNLFFQDWFQKKRDIEWFEISTRRAFRLKKESLFLGLPFKVVVDGELIDIGAKYSLRRSNHQEYINDLNQGDYFCSIDRGDKKLLILVREGLKMAHAQECANLCDILSYHPNFVFSSVPLSDNPRAYWYS